MVAATHAQSEWVLKAQRDIINRFPDGVEDISRVVRYTPHIHIPLLVESIGSGESVSHFCARAGISKANFYKWIVDEKKADFREVYELAKSLGEAIAFDLPLINENINMQYWKARLASQYRNTQVTIAGILSSSLEERLRGLKTSLNDGQITIMEFSTLMTSTLQEVKTAQAANLLNKLFDTKDKDVSTMNSQQLLEYVQSVALLAKE